MVVSKQSCELLKKKMALTISQLLPQIYHPPTYATYSSRPSHHLLAENLRRKCQPRCMDCNLHGGNHRDQLLRCEAFW